MPLKDHFDKPFTQKLSWDSFHSQWPSMMVLSLMQTLPKPFIAVPNKHFGRGFEVDISALEDNTISSFEIDNQPDSTGGVATLAALAPSYVMDADYSAIDDYEIQIYDTSSEQRLVAAIELVSPSNKDRPDHRRVFATKCANLLSQDVSVSIIDIVTARTFNLGRELLGMIGRTTPSGIDPPLYCTTFRPILNGRNHKVEVWEQPLTIGQPLPKLPLWLSDTLCLQFDLEESYEATCRVWGIL